MATGRNLCINKIVGRSSLWASPHPVELTMYLRDLALYASDEAPLSDNQRLQINQSAYTPVEAYLAALPRRTVVLGDLAKVNVAVGPRGKSQAYWDALNVAIIYWPRFDFPRYFQLSRARQQLRILEVLHKALLNIARRTQSDRSWYDSAYVAMRQQSFPLPEIEEQELLRRWGLLPRKQRQKPRRRKAPQSDRGKKS